jgi:hypothetical protein
MPNRLSVPVILLVATPLLYCFIPFYVMAYTRYLTGVILLSFVVFGYLAFEIIKVKPVMGYSILFLHMSCDLLSILPFTRSLPSYWQWELPHWMYRLVTGDQFHEDVTNFYLLLSQV